MLPVLFSIGNFAISSFGFFLSLAFLYGLFLVWRLARAWDFNEEKVIDLTLLTALFALIGSRIYFVLLHLDFFSSDLAKIILITKYPGFSFWGAFLGGWLALFIFSKRFKMDFWQVVDIAAVGFLGAQIFGNLGCFLGGCGVGIPSDFLGVKMIGNVGNRLPVQALEALIFAIILFKIWPKSINFHATGTIASLTLILSGLVKFFLEFLRGQTEGIFLSLAMFILGVSIFYKITKADFRKDVERWINTFVGIITDSGARKKIIQNIWKYCYNLKIKWNWQFARLVRLLRRLNVRSHPKNIGNN